MSTPSTAEQRFHATFEACATRVLAYALRHTDPDSAQDVVADVFLVAWRRVDDLPDEPLAWLLVVARNTLANRRRSRQRSTQLELRLGEVAGSPAAPAAEDLALERATMLHALTELTELEREAVLLVAWDGLSTLAAALVAGCSRNAFEARLHRARIRLERDCSPGPPASRTTLHPTTREARA